jgi:excisionase family DNA binding protein
MNDKLLTLPEVAERLRLSYTTVYKYVRAEVIPAIQLEKGWRVKESDLEKFLKSRTYST